MGERAKNATDEKVTLLEDGPVTKAGYEAWKEAKIKKALAEAEDRASMIAAANVWERFGFER